MQITIQNTLKFINTSEFVFYTSTDFVATEQPEEQLYTFPHTPLSLLTFLYWNFLKAEYTELQHRRNRAVEKYFSCI